MSPTLNPNVIPTEPLLHTRKGCLVARGSYCGGDCTCDCHQLRTAEVQPAITPTLLLDEEDAWVELVLAEDNLHEVLYAVVCALAGHAVTGDLHLIRHGGLEARRRAATNVLQSALVRDALTFRLDPAGADRLQNDLHEMGYTVRDLETCQYPDRDCPNLCEPAHTLCPIHEGK